MRFVMEDWLAPSVMRWPDPESGPWEVTLRWRAAGDRAECCGLSVDSMGGTATASVTATLMRSLPVAGLIASARQQRYRRAGGDVLEALADGQDLDVSPGLAEQFANASEPWTAKRNGRPVHLDRTFYRQVAEAYSLALASGRNPLMEVMDRWTTSRPTASRWVAAARAEGLLPPTERGRPRGNDVALTDITTEEKDR